MGFIAGFHHSSSASASKCVGHVKHSTPTNCVWVCVCDTLFHSHRNVDANPLCVTRDVSVKMEWKIKSSDSGESQISIKYHHCDMRRIQFIKFLRMPPNALLFPSHYVLITSNSGDMAPKFHYSTSRSKIRQNHIRLRTTETVFDWVTCSNELCRISFIFIHVHTFLLMLDARSFFMSRFKVNAAIKTENSRNKNIPPETATMLILLWFSNLIECCSLPINYWVRAARGHILFQLPKLRWPQACGCAAPDCIKLWIATRSGSIEK